MERGRNDRRPVRVDHVHAGHDLVVHSKLWWQKVTAPDRTATGGIGLTGATFLVLLTLKLTGLAEVSWLVVSLPLWVVPVGLAAALALFAVGALAFVSMVGLGSLVVDGFRSWRSWRWRRMDPIERARIIDEHRKATEWIGERRS